MPSFRTKALSLVLFLLAGTVCADELRDHFEKTYPLQRQGSFRLENTNGTVQVMAWERDEVKISAEKVVRASSAAEAQRILNEIEIVVRNTKDNIDVYTRTPKTGSESLLGLFFGKASGVSVNYTLTVPRDIYMKIISVNGKITAREISGKTELETTNGEIAVEDAAGSVSAETTNGRIEVSLREVAHTESMTFETTNGSVVAEFPRTFNAKISAHTTNGTVRCDFPIAARTHHRQNSLEGEIGESGGNVTLRTTNGSISIRRRS